MNERFKNSHYLGDKACTVVLRTHPPPKIKCTTSLPITIQKYLDLPCRLQFYLTNNYNNNKSKMT